MQTPNGKGPVVPERAAAPLDLRTAAAFCREGEYWTIAYEGTVFRLRDTKGLHCLASLLDRPGEKIAAAQLVANARDAEHARVLITKHVKAAIAKIATHHASRGHHLSTCIKTGRSCSSMPAPERVPPWRL